MYPRSLAEGLERASGKLKQALPKQDFAVAYFGVFLFITFYYCRPNDWIPGAEAVPFAKFAGIIAACGVLAALISHSREVIQSLFANRPLVWMLVFYGYTWLCLPFVFWRSNSLDILANDFSEVVLITGLMMVTITSVPRLRRLLVVSISVAAFASIFAIKSYLELGANQDRIKGIFKNVFSNPNDLALNVVILLPFCGAIIAVSKGPKRLFALACGALMVAGVIVSFSRAGFLALVTAGVLTVFQARRRRGLAVVLVVSATLILLLAAPGQFSDRIATITHPDADRTGSAQERREVLIQSIKITLEHPITGIGPGNFQWASGAFIGTHNIFTQVSSECGLPGLMFFLLMLHSTFRLTRASIGDDHLPRDLQLFVRASRMSIIVLLVGAFFYHCAYQFFTYFPIAYAVALRHMAENIPKEPLLPAKTAKTAAELLAMAYE